MHNIYLTGMIGAGKTTVGRAIARRLGWAFGDLDEEMFKDAGKDFRQVVADEGWLGFRVREYRICKGFAARERTVVALGGGTVRYEWNRDVLGGTGVVVLLTAGIDVHADRVRANDRPRVNPGVSIEEDLTTIWTTASDLYLSFADIVYPTDQGKSVEAEAEELVGLLRQQPLLRGVL